MDDDSVGFAVFDVFADVKLAECARVFAIAYIFLVDPYIVGRTCLQTEIGDIIAPGLGSVKYAIIGGNGIVCRGDVVGVFDDGGFVVFSAHFKDIRRNRDRTPCVGGEILCFGIGSRSHR